MGDTCTTCGERLTRKRKFICSDCERKQSVAVSLKNKVRQAKDKLGRVADIAISAWYSRG